MYTRRFTQTNNADDPEIIPMAIFALSDTTDTTPYGFANARAVIDYMADYRKTAPGFIEYVFIEIGPHKVTTEGRWESEEIWTGVVQKLYENTNWVTAYTDLCNRYRAAFNITQTPAPGSDPYTP